MESKKAEAIKTVKWWLPGTEMGEGNKRDAILGYKLASPRELVCSTVIIDSNIVL